MLRRDYRAAGLDVERRGAGQPAFTGKRQFSRVCETQGAKTVDQVIGGALFFRRTGQTSAKGIAEEGHVAFDLRNTAGIAEISHG